MICHLRAAVLLFFLGLGTCTSEAQPGQVRGQVISVENIRQAERIRFTVRETSGRTWLFEYDRSSSEPIHPDHLIEHWQQGLPITVIFEVKNGLRIAQQVLD
jgi:hypothetical protein